METFIKIIDMLKIAFKKYWRTLLLVATASLSSGLCLNVSALEDYDNVLLLVHLPTSILIIIALLCVFFYIIWNAVVRDKLLVYIFKKTIPLSTITYLIKEYNGNQYLLEQSDIIYSQLLHNNYIFKPLAVDAYTSVMWGSVSGVVKISLIKPIDDYIKKERKKLFKHKEDYYEI